MPSMIAVTAHIFAQANWSSTILLFAVIGLIFYFLIIRPQQKQKREHAQLLASLKKGDQVVTIGGIYGLITNVKDKTVVVKIADNVRVELTRSAIAQVLRSKADQGESDGAEETSGGRA